MAFPLGDHVLHTLGMMSNDALLAVTDSLTPKLVPMCLYNI